MYNKYFLFIFKDIVAVVNINKCKQMLHLNTILYISEYKYLKLLIIYFHVLILRTKTNDWTAVWLMHPTGKIKWVNWIVTAMICSGHNDHNQLRNSG